MKRGGEREKERQVFLLPITNPFSAHLLVVRQLGWLPRVMYTTPFMDGYTQ